MMAPKYMRAVLLQTVLDQAAGDLADPIVKVEISGRGVVVVSEREELLYLPQLTSSTDAEGHPLLGSDRWEIVLAQRAPLSGARSLLLRIRRVIGF